MITKVEFKSRKIALISAYAPNDFDKDFYNLITTKMLELTDYSFIVGADFNSVWDRAQTPQEGNLWPRML